VAMTPLSAMRNALVVTDGLSAKTWHIRDQETEITVRKIHT
jgi:hypothetical protein